MRYLTTRTEAPLMTRYAQNFPARCVLTEPKAADAFETTRPNLSLARLTGDARDVCDVAMTETYTKTIDRIAHGQLRISRGKMANVGRSRGSCPDPNLKVQDASTLLTPGRQTMPNSLLFRDRNYKPRVPLDRSQGNHTRLVAYLGVQAWTDSTEVTRQAIEQIRPVTVYRKTATHLQVFEEF